MHDDNGHNDEDSDEVDELYFKLEKDNDQEVIDG